MLWSQPGGSRQHSSVPARSSPEQMLARRARASSSATAAMEPVAPRNPKTDPSMRSLQHAAGTGSPCSITWWWSPRASTARRYLLADDRLPGGSPGSPLLLTLRTPCGLLPARRGRSRALVGWHSRAVSPLVLVDVDDLLALLSFGHNFVTPPLFPTDLLGSIVGR